MGKSVEPEPKMSVSSKTGTGTGIDGQIMEPQVCSHGHQMSRRKWIHDRNVQRELRGGGLPKLIQLITIYIKRKDTYGQRGNDRPRLYFKRRAWMRKEP